MKKVKSLIQRRDGTTLVEMIVTFLIISIMLAMATASLSSATRIFIRMQKVQQAQLVTDNVMTELQTIAKDATKYVKIYEDGTDVAGKNGVGKNETNGSDGKNSGQALEFVNAKGYAVLVTAQGCEKTDLKIGDKKNGTSDKVEQGRLLTRYYFLKGNKSEGYSYQYQENGNPVARAVAPVFGDGYYMGNYLKITYTFPKKTEHGVEKDTEQGDTIKSVTAEVSLCSDKECQNVVATQTGILEFRYKVVRWNDPTAKNDTTATEP